MKREADVRMRRCAGYEQEEAVELMRLYQTIHADHEARPPAPTLHALAGRGHSHLEKLALKLGLGFASEV